MATSAPSAPSVCALNYSAAENYVPRRFENTFSISFYHNRVPRFGYTNNLLDLVQGTKPEKADYVKGLMASTVALVIFLVIWILVLLICKCMGPKRVGWLSGSRVPLSTPRPKPKAAGDHKVGSKADDDAEDEELLTEDEEGPKATEDEEEPKAAENEEETKAAKDEEPKADEEGPKLPKDEEGLMKTAEDKDDSNDTERESEYNRVHLQQKRFKIIVSVALVIIVSMGVVFCAVGIKALISAVYTGLDTFDIVDIRLDQGVAFLDEILDGIATVKSDASRALESVNGICPRVTDRICQNLTDPTTCQADGPIGFVPAMQEAIIFLNQEGSLQRDLTAARDDLVKLGNKSESLADSTLNVQIALWAAMAFSIALGVICISFMIALWCKMPRIVRCLQLWCTYPLFFLLAFLSFVFSLVFIIASTAVADTCYDSPDKKIMTIVRDSIPFGSDIIIEIINTIFGGCFTPPERIFQNLDFLQNGVDVFDNFGEEVDDFKPVRKLICGPTEWDFEGVGDILNNRVNAYLCGAFNILSSFRDLFTCRFWYPLYANAVHGSLCYDAGDGFAVVASTQFIVVFMAFIVMTFRVALWDVPVSEDEFAEDETSEEKDAGNDGKEERKEQAVVLGPEDGQKEEDRVEDENEESMMDKISNMCCGPSPVDTDDYEKASDAEEPQQESAEDEQEAVQIDKDNSSPTGGEDPKQDSAEEKQEDEDNSSPSAEEKQEEEDNSSPT